MKIEVLRCPSCNALLEGNEQKCKFCRGTLLFDGEKPKIQEEKSIGSYFLEGLWHAGEDDKPWELPKKGLL